MTEKAPGPPTGLRRSGRRLWRAVVREYVLEEHESAMLRRMCEISDRLDELAEVLRRDGVMQPGVDRVHPALVEHRQQSVAFARLAAALRLPAGDVEADPNAIRRPQRRTGVRGFYSIKGGTA